MPLISSNLTALFWADEIRRVVTEAIIPYIAQNKAQIQKKLKKAASKLQKG